MNFPDENKWRQYIVLCPFFRDELIYYKKISRTSSHQWRLVCREAFKHSLLLDEVNLEVIFSDAAYKIILKNKKNKKNDLDL